jgi:hypothetical protein
VRARYEWWYAHYGEALGDELGSVYVLTDLLQEADRYGAADRHKADEGPIADSLVERRLGAANLVQWYRDEEQVPWWIAIRCGVHYSLVQCRL